MLNPHPTQNNYYSMFLRRQKKLSEKEVILLVARINVWMVSAGSERLWRRSHNNLWGIWVFLFLGTSFTFLIFFNLTIEKSETIYGIGWITRTVSKVRNKSPYQREILRDHFGSWEHGTELDCGRCSYIALQVLRHWVHLWESPRRSTAGTETLSSLRVPICHSRQWVNPNIVREGEWDV
jgi:hypothetical protein